MTPFGRLVRDLEPCSLLTLGDQLVVFGTHHQALFLDQTVTDALGGEGWSVRRQAAFEAAHALLASLCNEYGISGSRERLDLAAELFGAMGHGHLELDVTAEGGTVRGHDLFHGASFVDKYGGKIKNRKALDAFTAGFVAAAASLAFPSDWGALEAEETHCVARGDDRCEFFLTRRPERPRFGVIVTRAMVEGLHAPSLDERIGSSAARAAAEVAKFLHPLSAGDNGVCRDFGVRLALVPVSYANQIAFDTLHLVEKRTPELFPVAFTLEREAAQLGAFMLLGGILSSKQWRDEHGQPARDVELRLQQLVGITRALGWGAIYTGDFIPGRSLALRASITHDSAFYAIRHGATVRSRLAFLQGTALAIMQLLHRVDFFADEPLAPGTYDALFRGGTRFHVEETRSPLKGDKHCEVVVDALADR